MLVKLNSRNRGMAHYEPPIPVVRHFDDVDRSAPDDEQIDSLLWVAAVMVCRFLHQFPVLAKEADELFSIGMFVIVDTVKNEDHPGHLIGAVVNKKCMAAMEQYANSLNSIVSVSTKTRYNNLNANKETPDSVRLTNGTTTRVEDDDTSLIVEDAAEFLGIDLEKASLSERRKLARTLGLEEYL